MKSKKTAALIPEDISITDDELPEGWEIKKIKDITIKVPTVKPESEPEQIFGYVDIGSINNETNQIFDFKKFRGKDAPSRARQLIQPNDVLFSNVRTYLRNIAIVPDDLDVQVCSTGFTVLRTDESIDPKFLFYHTLTDGFINQVTPQQTGSQYPATTDRVVKDATISFPPLAEQQRIVIRVEALLAHINAACNRLSRVPLIMKKFRQAVLAAACSGRLTEGWREENPSKDTSDQLRDRVIKELQKNSVKSKKKSTVQLTQWDAFEPIELLEIPENWTWIAVKDATSLMQYGISVKSDSDEKSGIPILRMGNIQEGSIDLTDLKFIPANTESISNFVARNLLENQRFLTKNSMRFLHPIWYVFDLTTI